MLPEEFLQFFATLALYAQTSHWPSSAASFQIYFFPDEVVFLVLNQDLLLHVHQDKGEGRNTFCLRACTTVKHTPRQTKMHRYLHRMSLHEQYTRHLLIPHMKQHRKPYSHKLSIML